jgi:hypothetical protein
MVRLARSSTFHHGGKMLNGIGKRKRSEKGEGERTMRKEDGITLG